MNCTPINSIFFCRKSIVFTETFYTTINGKIRIPVCSLRHPSTTGQRASIRSAIRWPHTTGMLFNGARKPKQSSCWATALIPWLKDCYLFPIFFRLGEFIILLYDAEGRLLGTSTVPSKKRLVVTFLPCYDHMFHPPWRAKWGFCIYHQSYEVQIRSPHSRLM